MTRKDYILIAAALHRGKPEAHWDANKRVQYDMDVRNVATAFANDNPKFDRAFFLLACGVPS